MKKIIILFSLILLLSFFTMGESKKKVIKNAGVNKMGVSEISSAKRSIKKISLSKMFNSIVNKEKFPKMTMNCKLAYDIAMKIERNKLNQCVKAINAKWDSLSNSQLVQMCGNKPLQECYDDFVRAEKWECFKVIRAKMEELMKKYKDCIKDSVGC